MNPKTPPLYDRDYRGVRVALCQIATMPWDVRANLEATLAALEVGAAQGAEVAVTPECVLTGYGVERNRARQLQLLAENAEPADGASLHRLRDCASRFHMHVVVGFAERGAAGRFYNTAVLIDREGAVVDLYRKVHCRAFERIDGQGGFTPGDNFVVRTLTCREMDIRLGLMICFDREVTESVRCLRALGAELIACPLACDTASLNEPGNSADNEMVTRCRAAENEVFIAVVNHAGRFNGGSFVVGPGGEALTQLGASATVAVVDLPIEGVRTAHHGDPLGWMGWGYRRPEVYRTASASGGPACL